MKYNKIIENVCKILRPPAAGLQRERTRRNGATGTAVVGGAGPGNRVSSITGLVRRGF